MPVASFHCVDRSQKPVLPYSRQSTLTPDRPDGLFFSQILILLSLTDLDPRTLRLMPCHASMIVPRGTILQRSQFIIPRDSILPPVRLSIEDTVREALRGVNIPDEVPAGYLFVPKEVRSEVLLYI